MGNEEVNEMLVTEHCEDKSMYVDIDEKLVNKRYLRFARLVTKVRKFVKPFVSCNDFKCLNVNAIGLPRLRIYVKDHKEKLVS